MSLLTGQEWNVMCLGVRFTRSRTIMVNIDCQFDWLKISYEISKAHICVCLWKKNPNQNQIKTYQNQTRKRKSVILIFITTDQKIKIKTEIKPLAQTGLNKENFCIHWPPLYWLPFSFPTISSPAGEFLHGFKWLPGRCVLIWPLIHISSQVFWAWISSFPYPWEICSKILSGCLKPKIVVNSVPTMFFIYYIIPKLTLFHLN
jgi:hypothetical protein